MKNLKTLPKELTDSITLWIDREGRGSPLEVMYKSPRGYFTLCSSIRLLGQKLSLDEPRSCQLYLSGAKLQWQLISSLKGINESFLDRHQDILNLAEARYKIKSNISTSNLTVGDISDSITQNWKSKFNLRILSGKQLVQNWNRLFSPTAPTGNDTQKNAKSTKTIFNDFGEKVEVDI